MRKTAEALMSRALPRIFIGVALFMALLLWKKLDQGQSVASGQSSDQTSGVARLSQEKLTGAQPGAAEHAASGETAPAPTPSLPAESAAESEKIAAETKRRMAILNEILTSKNDNDPRLDREFRDLTPSLKTALREKYAEVPIENRNQRGTAVFLLGRAIQSESDVSFFTSVLGEPPCLSLSDCAHKPSGAVDEHASMANEITVNYPQIVAIHSLEKFLLSPGALANPAARQAAIEALQKAEKSDQPRVAAAAAQALQNIPHN